MKVMILSASVSPMAYDLKEIASLTYDAAKKFFENDEIGCCTVKEFEVDQAMEYEMCFHADGIPSDGSDTMFNWLKVIND